MNDELKQTIKSGVEKLPKEIQEVINVFDWVKVSEEICKRNLLDEVEVNILQNEIGLVLIETKNQDVLALNIENNVGTTKNESIKISEEINQKIFTPMKEKINSLIKNNLYSKTQSWDKTINFIISGGNYSSFLEQ
jgi:hypothetical protein